MDQKKCYYNYIMPKVNAVENSFPFFVSNQNLYIMVPVSNPTVFNQTHENFSNIQNTFTEEEILPDFRCKICSATIFNYHDFKIHVRDHEKDVEDISKKPIHFEDDGIRGLENENNRIKSDFSEHIRNVITSDQTEHSNYFGTESKNVKLMPQNNEFSFEIASNKLLEEQKKCLTSNKSFVMFVNSAMPLNSFQDLNCPKSEEPMDIQNNNGYKKQMGAEFKKPNLTKLPSTQISNKFNCHTFRNNLSKHTEKVSQSVTDGFPYMSVFNKENNSPVIKKEIIHKFSREGNLSEKNNIPIVEPSPSTTTLPLIYTTLNELLIPYNKKINTFVIKPNVAYSCSQFQSMEQSTKHSSEFKEFSRSEVGPDVFPRKVFKPNIDKVHDCLSESPQLADVRNSCIPVPTQNETSVEDNPKNKTTGYVENIICKNSLPESMGVNEYSAAISKSLTDAKEKAFHGGQKSGTYFQKTDHLLQLQSKSIPCVLCESSFSSISTLRKHLRMLHCANKDRRQCPYCNYRCFQTSDLEKHIARRHTRDFKFKCRSCTKGFTTPKELKKHKERKHLKQKSNE